MAALEDAEKLFHNKTKSSSSGLKPLGMTKIKDLFGTTEVVP
jgi:hypothetical protein